MPPFDLKLVSNQATDPPTAVTASSRSNRPAASTAPKCYVRQQIAEAALRLLLCCTDFLLILLAFCEAATLEGGGRDALR
jgi:hypothetical protein